MKTSMPWIKLYTEMLDDPKIGRLQDSEKWRFVQLILYAGEVDEEGYLPANLVDVAWRLRLDMITLQTDLRTFEQAGLVHFDEDAGRWCVSKFSERQGRTQAEQREMWKTRQQRRREKIVTGDSPVTHDVTQRGVTLLEEEEEEESDKEEEEDKDSNAGKPAQKAPAAPLSLGQQYFLRALGATRFKTIKQRDCVLALEVEYGMAKLQEGADWAAKRGMNIGSALLSLEKALPNWGQPKNGNGSRASPGPPNGIRDLMKSGKWRDGLDDDGNTD
jgi:hypothetical protein